MVWFFVLLGIAMVGLTVYLEKVSPTTRSNRPNNNSNNPNNPFGNPIYDEIRRGNYDKDLFK